MGPCKTLVRHGNLVKSEKIDMGPMVTRRSLFSFIVNKSDINPKFQYGDEILNENFQILKVNKQPSQLITLYGDQLPINELKKLYSLIKTNHILDSIEYIGFDHWILSIKGNNKKTIFHVNHRSKFDLLDKLHGKYKEVDLRFGKLILAQ